MPIEVSDIAPTPALLESEVAEEAAPDEEGEKEGAPEASAVDVSPAPAPKKKGRPPGSKNKPKVAAQEGVAPPQSAPQAPEVQRGASKPEAAESAPVKKREAATRRRRAASPQLPREAQAAKLPREARAPKRAPKPPPVYESESEEEEAELSPMSQRRAQWAAYRQAQVDAHQARVSHYSKALNRMLAF